MRKSRSNKALAEEITGKLEAYQVVVEASFLYQLLTDYGDRKLEHFSNEYLRDVNTSIKVAKEIY